ncbi:MAG: diguanylate cyclase domain-containing protein [Myxococcota bacterium]
MNSVRHILILSGRSEFRDRLADAAGEFFDVRLELVDDLERALEILDAGSIDVVIVDNAPEFDVEATMKELIPVIDSMSRTPLLCFVGQREGVEMEASLVFTRDASAEEILSELSGVPKWSRASADETADSPEQPRFIVPDSGFRHPSTSGHFSGLVRRLMYVGDRMEFRQGLAAQSESRGVELILRDSPNDVVWPKGAQSLSVVAIEIDENFDDARRLVGYLRERHMTTGFRVVFLEPDADGISGPVSEILGADHVLAYDATPKDLFDTVFESDETGLKGRVLVVSSRNGLIRTIETVLGSEGMVVDVRRRLEGILAYLDEAAPEIILFDCGSRAFDAEALAEQLLRERPHLRARLLGIPGQTDDDSEADDDGQLEESSTTTGDQWDLAVEPPVSGGDLRRAVNLLLQDVERGRERFEHDRLTNVRRPAGLPDTIAAEMSAAASTGENLLVVGLDIDDLSLLNVRYSWGLGDSVLRTLADTLSVAVGGRENIFRHDDMFFVVRRGDADACQAVRSKIEDFIELFQRQTFRSEDGRGTYATVSGGAVIVPPLDIPPETVLEKCWIVLERACSSRRNNLLVAQLDPESFPSVASRKKARTGDGE